MHHYCSRVLAQNPLRESALFLLKSNNPWLYVDRHVGEPETTDGLDVVISTCVAGIRLMNKWKAERIELMQEGFLISDPVLIIDDEWLTEAQGAPPPHVYVVLAKDQASYRAPHFADHGGNDFEAFPLKESLRKESGWTRAVRSAANPNLDQEGGWLFF